MVCLANTMVCVTRQVSCKRLIEAGARFAQEQNGELTVVHVVQPDAHFLGNPNDGDALEYLFSIAKEHDAGISVLRSKDLIQTLAQNAKKLKITHIILGVSPIQSVTGTPADVAQRLKTRLPHVEIISIPA